MQWPSFARRPMVTQASEVLFIVPPQRRRPRARCVPCDRVLSLVHPWLVVWPLAREEGFRAAAATIDPIQGETWCADCAHTWLGVHLIATDAPASAAEYWGTIIRSDVRALMARHPNDTKCQL